MPRGVDALNVIETLLVVLGVAALAGVGLVAPLVPPDALMLAGGVVTALGLGAGLPTGLWYHVALYRCLRPRMALPRRWWLDPVALHPLLLESERPRVRAWFVAGGIGFVVVVLGCVLTVFGLVAHWLALRSA
jgi:hypothetical protein